jgi:acyl-CoA synthetase (AMP-forming)/AMP-acid ligase II
VIADSERVTESDLRAHMAGLLQPVKIPRFIEFVEELNLGRTGKVVRDE